MKKTNRIDSKKKIQILFKMVLTHMQFTSIINVYKMKWPYDVNLFLSSISGVFMTSSGVISLKCIVDGYSINIHPLYLETLFVSLLPFMICLVMLCFLIFSCFFTKTFQKIRFYTIFISINTFLQPSVITKLFDNLNYQKFDEKFLLVSNLDIELFSEFHMKWVFL